MKLVYSWNNKAPTEIDICGTTGYTISYKYRYLILVDMLVFAS